MADSKTISAENEKDVAPEWVLRDEHAYPGPQNTGRNPQEMTALRTSLWRSGAYDLPPEFTTKANDIAAECAALLPFLERVASRWVDFESAVVRHYADVPDHSNLSVPCTQNPDRRAADVAIQSVADAVDYDRLCGLAYERKDPTVEARSAGGHSELTDEDLSEQLAEALHALTQAYGSAGGTVIAVLDALEAQPSAAQVVEAERVLRESMAGAAMLKTVSGNTAK